jgi:hypothetical protein
LSEKGVWNSVLRLSKGGNIWNLFSGGLSVLCSSLSVLFAHVKTESAGLVVIERLAPRGRHHTTVIATDRFVFTGSVTPQHDYGCVSVSASIPRVVIDTGGGGLFFRKGLEFGPT